MRIRRSTSSAVCSPDAEQAPQAREQRLDVRFEEPRLQVGEQVLHRQQRADLGGVEP